MAKERAAVKSYREYVEKLLRDEMPRPRCPVEGCTRRPQRRGVRERLKVRDSSGVDLGPILIVRFCCLEHGWIPAPPECMLPWVRTVALGVESRVETYVVEGRSAAATMGDTVDGDRCLRRWVARLSDLGISAWVQRSLDALRPEARPPDPCPPRARPTLWAALARVRLLAEALRERGFPLGSPLALLWSFPLFA